MVLKQWIWIKKQSKVFWGFKGTERPGAVYLASVLASHAQKVFSFRYFGHDVQNADATDIPEDVQEKLLRFGRAAVAVATMRGKSYLQIGSLQWVLQAPSSAQNSLKNTSA